EDEAPPHRDAVVREHADDVRVFARLVLAFARASYGRVAHRLEPDEERLATGARHDLDVFDAMERRERRLRDPVLSERHHRLEEIVRVLLVNHHVVVAEEDSHYDRLELANDLSHRSKSKRR